MIKVTFDCPDAEIASFLSIFYVLYTDADEDPIDNAQLISRMLGPALGYLRDKISDLLGDGNKLYGYEISPLDIEMIRRLAPVRDEVPTEAVKLT